MMMIMMIMLVIDNDDHDEYFLYIINLVKENNYLNLSSRSSMLIFRSFSALS